MKEVLMTCVDRFFKHYSTIYSAQVLPCLLCHMLWHAQTIRSRSDTHWSGSPRTSSQPYTAIAMPSCLWQNVGINDLVACEVKILMPSGLQTTDPNFYHTSRILTKSWIIQISYIGYGPHLYCISRNVQQLAHCSNLVSF